MLIGRINALGFILICLQVSSSFQKIKLKTVDELLSENQIEIPKEIADIVENVFANLSKASTSTGMITNLRYVDHNDARVSLNTNGGSQESYLSDKQNELYLKAYDELLHYDGEEDLVYYLENNIKIPKTYCPKLQIKCNKYYQYRIPGGECNNLKHSWWGKANTPYRRFIKPLYDDNIGKLRTKGKDGFRLPNERQISIYLIPSFETKSKWTNFFFSFGQFITHDMSKFAVTTNADGSSKSCTCESADKNCYSIPTPYGDHINKDQECMTIVRASMAPKDLECNFGAREQMNLVSGYLDLGLIYGDDAKTVAELRTFEDGLFRVSYTPHSNLEQLAARNDTRCPFSTNRADKCFRTGDSRCEDNVLLLSQHALWMREHNRVARKLAYLNPYWDDETLYQEAKRVVTAEYQHIISSEYLPVFLGHKLAREFDLLPFKEGYSKLYDEKRPAGIINAFATAGFRVSHTMINDEHELADNYFNVIETQNISVLQFNTAEFAIKSPLEKVLYGSIGKPAYEKRCQMNTDMKDHLFEKVFSNSIVKRWDLASRNMARGRDNGLRPYNDYREKCGLNRAETFEDLSNNIPDYLIQKLKKIYKHVDNIDLYVGLISEEPLKDAVAGFTSACLVAKQFSDSRAGDRFWYDNGHDPLTRFTLKQLQEIREVSISRIVCDNSDVKYIQRHAFLVPHPEYNPFVDCDDLPRVNLGAWQDYGVKRNMNSYEQENDWQEEEDHIETVYDHSD